MSDLPTLFKGNARVYLQGRNALLPLVSESSSEVFAYCIGTESTNLVVRDHRPGTVAEASQIIVTRYQNGFAKHFNQLAYVVVKLDEASRKMEIDLYESRGEVRSTPIVWMGILENNTMPGYAVAWEVFREVDLDRTAFVALIPARQDAGKLNPVDL